MDIATTELFDLFGETGLCTICQEDLHEGDRVRTIAKCQHLFHARCLDPWLVRKPECPLCRTELGGPTAAQLVQSLDEIHQILTQQQEPRLVLHRTILSFVLIHGFLKMFPTAAAYTPFKHQLRSLLENFTLHDTRPMLIDTTCRANLLRQYRQLRTVLAQKMNLSYLSLYMNADVRLWRDRVAAQPALREFWI
jgi:hypothetical protein